MGRRERFKQEPGKRRHEWRRGTQECGRHVSRYPIRRPVPVGFHSEDRWSSHSPRKRKALKPRTRRLGSSSLEKESPPCASPSLERRTRGKWDDDSPHTERPTPSPRAAIWMDLALRTVPIIRSNTQPPTRRPSAPEPPFQPRATRFRFRPPALRSASGLCARIRSAASSRSLHRP